MAKFEMDTEFVRKLAEILEENDLGEIELADGDRKIRIARPTVTYAAAPMAVPAGATPAAAAPSAGPPAANDLAKHAGAVKSPMVGTAYLAPACFARSLAAGGAAEGEAAATGLVPAGTAIGAAA